MNIFPELVSTEESAVDALASVLNKAKETLGEHLTLQQLRETREGLAPPQLLEVKIKQPIAINSEHFIKEVVEKEWELTKTFLYHIRYAGCSTDENSVHYYFEVKFSQPTVKYPIPQATVSVFFRIQDKQNEKPLSSKRDMPTMKFRVEGHYRDHDVRFVRLPADWILGVLQMKLKFFRRIEEFKQF